METVPISPWLGKTEPSPTLAVKAQADELRLSGKLKVYDFGVGEINSPEIPCPPALTEEIISAVRSGDTHYCLAAGDVETRGAIAADLRANFDLHYDPDCIAVMNGPKDAIYKLLVATMAGRSEGQRRRVACFAPYYETFVSAPLLITGASSVVLPCGPAGFPVPDDLAAALADRSLDIGAIIICSPNNPTGQVYPESLLRGLAEACRGFPSVLVISDETYRSIIYQPDDVINQGGDGRMMTPSPTRHWSIASVLPNQTAVVAGMSKELSGTGLRIGFVAGPQHIVNAVAEVSGNTSSCANLPSAKAYGRVLARDRNMAIRGGITHKLALRRQALLKAFQEFVPDAEWRRSGYSPLGAYYFFPSLMRYIGRTVPDTKDAISDDTALATYILARAGVVCLPGSCFGMPGRFRFAYALMTPEDIRAGVRALGGALKELEIAHEDKHAAARARL